MTRRPWAQDTARTHQASNLARPVCIRERPGDVLSSKVFEGLFGEQRNFSWQKPRQIVKRLGKSFAVHRCAVSCLLAPLTPPRAQANNSGHDSLLPSLRLLSCYQRQTAFPSESEK